MSISEAYVRATCDGCGTTQEVELPVGARNTYLFSRGSIIHMLDWTEYEGQLLCEECREESING